MIFYLVTVFPELVDAFARVGLLGRAQARGLLTVAAIDPRDYTSDKHRSVDDAPYGGGSGMVMMPGPLVSAMEAAAAQQAERKAPSPHRILLTPQGLPYTQATARALTKKAALTLVCGRYEGVDERVREAVDAEISLGDFVLMGGEVAALAVVETVARLLPGVLGNPSSTMEESHQEALLEYPQYTRPETFRGRSVPAVLRSGNHEAIARWRRQQALARTAERRPDLLAKATITPEERAWLSNRR